MENELRIKDTTAQLHVCLMRHMGIRIGIIRETENDISSNK